MPACRRCQTCRKRKIRCDGGKPACSTCVLNRHECLGYSPSTTPGPAPNGKIPQIKRQESGDDIKNEDEDNRDGSQVPLLNSEFKTSSSKSPVDNANGRLRSSASSPDVSSRDRDSKYSEDDGEGILAANRFVRVPYFRWFGPTAIVKGYKQMIAQVREDTRPAGGPTSLSSGEIAQTLETVR